MNFDEAATHLCNCAEVGGEEFCRRCFRIASALKEARRDALHEAANLVYLSNDTDDAKQRIDDLIISEGLDGAS